MSDTYLKNVRKKKTKTPYYSTKVSVLPNFQVPSTVYSTLLKQDIGSLDNIFYIPKIKTLSIFIC